MKDSKHDNTSTPTEISFTLPGGTRIVAKLCGDAEDPNQNVGWASIDICAQFPTGGYETLCCAYFTTPNDKSADNPDDYNRLRVMLMPDDYPATTMEPLEHRSIWLTHDEGTYDINVWNEDTEGRDPLEESYIPTLDEAAKRMEEIIQAHPEILWTRKPLEEK